MLISIVIHRQKKCIGIIRIILANIVELVLIDQYTPGILEKAKIYKARAQNRKIGLIKVLKPQFFGSKMSHCLAKAC